MNPYTRVSLAAGTLLIALLTPLPKAAKEFVEYVEEYTGVPVKYIGIGPDVRNTIVR